MYASAAATTKIVALTTTCSDSIKELVHVGRQCPTVYDVACIMREHASALVHVAVDGVQQDEPHVYTVYDVACMHVGARVRTSTCSGGQQDGGNEAYPQKYAHRK